MLVWVIAQRGRHESLIYIKFWSTSALAIANRTYIIVVVVVVEKLEAELLEGRASDGIYWDKTDKKDVEV